MWVLSDDKSSMMPLLPFSIDGVPWHSNQYAALPLFYTQNASLEVARSSCITQLNSISGNRISPFITPDCEDIDINTKEDWNKLLCGIQEDKYILPAI
jgi:N-acylneuraminate cytidylyltransferase